MPSKTSPDKIIEGYLFDDVRVMNAQIPRERKSLEELLHEERPHVLCMDGSPHHFRKRELDNLSRMMTDEERHDLLLPILMEVASDRVEVIIRTRSGADAKVISAVLNMPVTVQDNKITIFRPQLQVIRKTLKTTTQYVFFT
ncbi:MAG: DUF61 family protein [Deltaproteobacteria bacterium]|nr:DUF61 family protein [Deltaproteobacteria bacterium]